MASPAKIRLDVDELLRGTSSRSTRSLNVPGRLPKDASALFARNVLNFLTPHVDKESKSLKFNWEDETVRDTVVCRDGQVVSPLLQGEAK